MTKYLKKKKEVLSMIVFSDATKMSQAAILDYNSHILENSIYQQNRNV